jgi:hypothetical protein
LILPGLLLVETQLDRFFGDGVLQVEAFEQTGHPGFVAVAGRGRDFLNHVPGLLRSDLFSIEGGDGAIRIVAGDIFGAFGMQAVFRGVAGGRAGAGVADLFAGESFGDGAYGGNVTSDFNAALEVFRVDALEGVGLHIPGSPVGEFAGDVHRERLAGRRDLFLAVRAGGFDVR